MSAPFEIRIRASSTPSYADCALRTAAKIWRPMFRDAGIELRAVSSSAGAIVGSSLHAGAAYLLTSKMEADDLGNQTEAEQRAFEEMDRRIGEEGVTWDDTTGDLNAAQAQTRKMVASYRIHIVPKVRPVAVEQPMEAQLRPGVLITGTADLLENDILHDTKSGVRQRVNLAQYGVYSLLRRTAEFEVNGIVEDYVPRVGMKKLQPEPTTTPYSIYAAEQLAMRTLNAMADDAARFKETGDPLAFLPNSGSQMCSDKYCPAWGTTACRVHKGAAN